jgi:hypothetical protein
VVVWLWLERGLEKRCRVGPKNRQTIFYPSAAKEFIRAVETNRGAARPFD